MMSMAISYEEIGRTRQKARTRAALVDAARELLSKGRTPTVEEAAEVAAVSRATAYRYFPNQRALLVAAHPEIEPGGNEELLLRQGRAIGWIEDALDPLRPRLSRSAFRRLVLAIRSACGIEALVWLTDVAKLSRPEAAELMRWSALALLRAAQAEPQARARRP